MKRLIAAAASGVALLGLFSWSQGEEPSATENKPAASDKPATASFWMKKKLEYSEQILAGLANEDFAQIQKNARSMDGLTQIENWVHGSRPGYRAQLAIFHDANQRLIQEAEAEDLDGTALAFLELTMSCVNCHKLVRGAVGTAAHAK